MNRMRKIVCCYLVLCLAVGGSVALSPILHQLVEHGGVGSPHVHLAKLAARGQHRRLALHNDSLQHDSEPSTRAGLFEHTYKPFGLPRISLAKLWHALHHFVDAAAAGESSPANEEPGHEHHSVFQLLAGGFVEQPLESPVLPFILTEFVAVDFPPHALLLAPDWDAQTASRAPPLSQS